jgi:hypothetical protein
MSAFQLADRHCEDCAAIFNRAAMQQEAQCQSPRTKAAMAEATASLFDGEMMSPAMT